MILNSSALKEPVWEELPVKKRYIYKWLYHKIPKRVKRLIFVSSIIGLLDVDKSITNELIAKINSLLKIAHNPDAMYFPIAVKSIIWRKLVKNPTMIINGIEYNISDLRNIRKTDKYYDSLSKFILNAAPEWLRYGSAALMEYDIQILCLKVLA